MGRKKGDFVFQTGHVIEIVTKLFLVVQNATTKPPEVHISTEYDKTNTYFFNECDFMTIINHSDSRQISGNKPLF